MQRIVATVACVLLASVAFAGCSDGGGDGDEQSQSEPTFDVRPTETTGIIRGVVVDERIVPLVDATVQIKGVDMPNETTDADGAFGFQGLEPGTYFMEVSKKGYFRVQASADVVAGEEEPSIVRVVLRADVLAQPYWQSYVYDGYIQCTTSVLVLCGIANVFTGSQVTEDRFAWDQYFGNNASHIQAEMVWDSTQALSPELYFEMEALHEDCDKSEDGEYEDIGSFLNNTEGASPIYATINETQVKAWSIGEVCPVWVSIFSGGVAGTPVGFTVQQKFSMYFHTFHSYLPPPGWRFAVDGPPPDPA